eukprot:COSAG05_NODE_5591_length_1134_cov_1.906280_1_plen_44_part_10
MGVRYVRKPPTNYHQKETLRVRANIIGHARINYVGIYQSCMVSN